MAHTIGWAIVVGFFLGVFVWCVKEDGLKSAVIAYSLTAVLVILAAIAAMLIAS